MADVAAVVHAIEAHLLKSLIGAGEGLVETGALGGHRQHPATGAQQTALVIAARAGVEQLVILAGLQIDLDGIAVRKG